MPTPNAAWRFRSFRSRVMSKRSGSSQASGSRLAEPNIMYTLESTGMSTPWRLTGQVFVRNRPCTGASKRRLSSTAFGMRVRSWRSSAICSGRSSRRLTRLLISRVVVSDPATSRNWQKPTICFSVSRWPSRSTVSNRVRRSSGTGSPASMAAARPLMCGSK